MSISDHHLKVFMGKQYRFMWIGPGIGCVPVTSQPSEEPAGVMPFAIIKQCHVLLLNSQMEVEKNDRDFLAF